MPELVRRLNADGIAVFSSYIDRIRAGDAGAPPLEILTDPARSSPLDEDIQFETGDPANRFALGQYLVALLAPLDRRKVSRDPGLWTWLSLRMFEKLCPPATDGSRDVLAPEAYVLPSKYDFRSYYRHLVRTPWMAVADHGEYAKILLIPVSAGKGNPLSVRGEIIEQLASRQALLRNRRVIEAAHRLYWDSKKGKPRSKTGGSSGGSPRRLALVLQQFDVTYDLEAAPPETIVALLPREFDKWKEAS